MMDALHIDFETRSPIDLKVEGLDKYCAHPLTGVMCMAYSFGDGPVFLWYPGLSFPAEVWRHVAAGRLLVAHNAQFEHQIWNRVLRRQCSEVPILSLSQLRCTMAKCYAMSLPGSLENALIAIGATERKDAEGRRIMLQLSQPRKVLPDGMVIWWTKEEFPEKYERLYQYCEQDVRSEQELDALLVDLSLEEQKLWELDQTINARGIAFDRAAVLAADKLAASEKERLDSEMQRITGGFVGTCNSHGAVRQWMAAQGVQTESVDKAAILDLLSDPALPSTVRSALLTRQEAAKSSTAKLDSILSRGSTDDRLRFIFQYHAAVTGRWGGRGVQPHNFVRPKIKPKDVEWIIATLKSGQAQVGDAIRMFYGAPLDMIPNCLRGMLAASPGRDLIAGDYKNIEGRVGAWFCGENWKVQAFRDYDAGIGPDVYRLTYSRSFNVPIEQVSESGEDRQVGKVQELACLYQGWVGAMTTMCKTYNVEMSEESKERAAGLWREAHPATRATWPALEAAGIQAVSHPGEKVTVQMPGSPASVVFCMNGPHLWLRLPSGRALCYPYAEVFTKVREFTRDDGSTYTKENAAVRYLGENSETHQWDWQDTYGGLWLENIVQAIARDILAAAMKRLEAHGLPVVLHVHDEAVVEVSENDSTSVADYCAIMAIPLPWTTGLPIAVGGWRGRRYKKE